MTSLDPRASRLLHALIAKHIRDGEPVASRSLARLAGLEVSPATIRNIMANLESVGLLAAPHTSSGRVPTSQAYRVFVDSLLEIEPLRETEINRLREEIEKSSDSSLNGMLDELRLQCWKSSKKSNVRILTLEYTPCIHQLCMSTKFAIAIGHLSVAFAPPLQRKPYGRKSNNELKLHWKLCVPASSPFTLIRSRGTS